MHNSGKITCSKKSNCLDLVAKLRAETNVGKPIVTIPKPIKNFKINNPQSSAAVIGTLKNAPIIGKIKLIPEKKNL